MLWTIAAILLILWILGLVSAYTLGGFIHILLILAVIAVARRKPEGELARALDRDVGGFERFRRQLPEVAGTVMGSGWAALVWEPIGKRLLTTQIYDHPSNLSQAGVPLMLIDAWEHAYYL